jgi:hypothetical protein
MSTAHLGETGGKYLLSMVSHTTRHTTLRIIREHKMKKRKGGTGPLSQGVQEGRQAPRNLHIHAVEVHRQRPRGFQ